MAPKRNSKIIILILTLALCFASIPTPALAASAHEASTKTHLFKFYLDPILVPDIDFAKTVLPKYINDMNVILAKNTNRLLAFDPTTGIILANTQPHSNTAPVPLPVDGFEIWAYAVTSPYQVSYGGYMGVDTSGAGVLAGLKWTRLYDPDKLKPDEVADYWTQINNMLHELAHVFGAGIGEYYNLSIIKDMTNVPPFLDINILNPEDAFWKDKPDFITDPLLQNPVRTARSGSFSSRESLLAFVQYSKLTASVINGDYRNSVPTVDLSNIVLHVVDNNGVPVRMATVKIWSITGNTSYQSQLMLESSTDDNGQITFTWGGSATPHNIYDFLRLIKVYQDGYVASAKYVSIFDADIVKLVNDDDNFYITITLNKVEANNTSTSTFADVPISDMTWRSIESIYSTGITGGCGLSPLIYCPTVQVTRAQIAVFLERGIHGSSYNPPATGSNTGFADVQSTYWAAAWIKQLATEGITGGCGSDNYCPETPVTRAQMAVFMVKAFNLP
jgi:S-layer family protein